MFSYEQNGERGITFYRTADIRIPKPLLIDINIGPDHMNYPNYGGSAGPMQMSGGYAPQMANTYDPNMNYNSGMYRNVENPNMNAMSNNPTNYVNTSPAPSAPPKKVMVMKRSHNRSSDSQKRDLSSKSQTTSADKEKAYAEARARIFGESSSDNLAGQCQDRISASSSLESMNALTNTDTTSTQDDASSGKQSNSPVKNNSSATGNTSSGQRSKERYTEYSEGNVGLDLDVTSIEDLRITSSNERGGNNDSKKDQKNYDDKTSERRSSDADVAVLTPSDSGKSKREVPVHTNSNQCPLEADDVQILNNSSDENKFVSDFESESPRDTEINSSRSSSSTKGKLLSKQNQAVTDGRNRLSRKDSSPSSAFPNTENAELVECDRDNTISNSGNSRRKVVDAAAWREQKCTIRDREAEKSDPDFARSSHAMQSGIYPNSKGVMSHSNNGGMISANPTMGGPVNSRGHTVVHGMVSNYDMNPPVNFEQRPAGLYNPNAHMAAPPYPNPAMVHGQYMMTGPPNVYQMPVPPPLHPNGSMDGTTQQMWLPQQPLSPTHIIHPYYNPHPNMAPVVMSSYPNPNNNYPYAQPNFPVVSGGRSPPIREESQTNSSKSDNNSTNRIFAQAEFPPLGH
jgi:hypothetical protein